MTIVVKGRVEAERIAMAVQVACMDHCCHEKWATDVSCRIRRQVRDCDERAYRRKLADVRMFA